MSEPRTRSRHLPLAFALLAYLGALALLRPFGDVYYGGDDFAYAWSVEQLVKTGHLHTSDWSAAAIVPQTYWAASFVKVFGFHPWVVNLSSLVASVIGAVLLYFSGLALRLRESTSAWLSLFMVASPIYLGFASSFMTDIHYAVLAIAATLSTLHTLRRKSVGLAALAGVFSALALLNRQVGVAIPLALGVALLAGLWLRRFELDFVLRAGAGGCLIPFVVLLAYQCFPDAFGGRTLTQAGKLDSAAMWRRLLSVGTTLDHGYLALIYVLVLVLPLLVAIGYPSRARILTVLRSKPWRQPALLLGALSLAAYALKLATEGSFGVRGAFFRTSVTSPAVFRFLDPAWSLLALVASLAFPVIVVVVLDWLRPAAREPNRAVLEDDRTERQTIAAFLFVCLAVHWALVAIFVSYFNNYFLPLILLAALLVSPAFVAPGEATETDTTGARTAKILRFALAAVSILGSVVSLERHFRYVEADTRVADSLVARGFDAAKICAYPAWYGRNNYRVVEATLREGVWGVWKRISKRCTVFVLESGAHPPSGTGHVDSTATYSTLAGTDELDVWVKAVDEKSSPRDDYRPKKRRKR